MWFNSMQREEPYLLLTSMESCRDTGVPSGTMRQGAAWLSSARVVKCWVKSRNERNPYPLLPSDLVGNSKETASDKLEEGGDDVKSSWPLRVGLHTCYNGVYRGWRNCEVERISESTSKSGLESATRLHEVGIASNRESECRGEYVPGPCTHRPSHHGSGLYQK